MSIMKSDAEGQDGVGRVYTVVHSTTVNASKLKDELEAILGVSLSGTAQNGHLVTAELAYGAGVIIQVRLNQNTPALNAAAEAALEQAVLKHNS